MAFFQYVDDGRLETEWEDISEFSRKKKWKIVRTAYVDCISAGRENQSTSFRIHILQVHDSS